jgi:hypothetical protein
MMFATVTDWQNAGTEEHPEARLYGSFVLDSHPMHVEAIQVVEDELGFQEAADSMWSEQLDMAARICGARMQTFTKNGRSYILVATSFGD